ncbi:alpha/beta hydrolase [Veronia pacifica]|uniref:alpha/beta hydrolase n=1 Tax=Veronia pacifica TaxID=1080227 RepID=UPI00158667B2|nr:alpha/beta hydrolase [Veronia pacifica]
MAAGLGLYSPDSGAIHPIRRWTMISTERKINHTERLKHMALAKYQRRIGSLIGITPPIDILPPKLVRPTLNTFEKFFGLKKEKMHRVSNYKMPLSSSPGNFISLKVFHPAEKTPKRTMVYFHGGGFVLGSIATHENLIRKLASRCNISIVAVDYRLAPENKFPTAIVDCVDAWNWINEHAAELGVSTNNIGVGGDSAGGYLALSVSLSDTRRGLPVISQSMPDFQFLLYPITDTRGQTASYSEFDKNLMLTTEVMDYFYKHFFTDPELKNSPGVSPLLAENLSTLPKTYLLTVEYDPLRDEGQQMVQRLKDAGVSIFDEHFDDCMHAFPHFAGICNRARESTDVIAQRLGELVA